MKKIDFLQLLKFGSVGFINTLLDYGFFYLFFSLCNFDKNIAQILSAIIAMTNSYLLNRYWTFGKRDSVHLKEIWRFLIVNFLSLGTTLLFLNLFYDWLEVHQLFNSLLYVVSLPTFLQGDMAVLFCKILAFPFSWIVNFFGNRLWVFAEK